jgi:NADPH-ferrihemoprotein reductase
LTSQSLRRTFEKALAAKAAAAAAVPKGPKVSLYFGSQTGTAEGFAKDIASKLKRLGLSPSVIDLEDVQPDSIQHDTLALFFIATTGEGDATDNAAIFVDWIKHEDREHDNDLLQRLKFAVFALGNKEYEHYNSVGKLVDEKLVQMGGQQILPIGLGDDNDSMEDDFEGWQENVLPLVRAIAFPNSVAPVSNDKPSTNMEPLVFPYKAVNVNPPADPRVVRDEGRFDTRQDEQPMGKLDRVAKSYFECTPCKVLVNRELRKSPGADGLGSTLHLEIDLKNSGLEYNGKNMCRVTCLWLEHRH